MTSAAHAQNETSDWNELAVRRWAYLVDDGGRFSSIYYSHVVGTHIISLHSHLLQIQINLKKLGFDSNPARLEHGVQILLFWILE